MNMILTKSELLNLVQEDIEHTQWVIDTLKENELALDYMQKLQFMSNYIEAIEDVMDIEEDKNLSLNQMNYA